MENQAPGRAGGTNPKYSDSKSDDSPNQKGVRTTKRTILLEQVRESSAEPGVYLMKDAAGQVLYVGKAKVLRNRLLQYFQPIEHEMLRIEMMLRRVDHFDVILTETEAEALILECTLIKKYRPQFNIRLKDDKAYPYIRIEVGESFPRLEWTRKVKRDGSRYFGPFPGAWSARQIQRLLTEKFQLRDCSDNSFKHRSRACILYQMGQCSAPCVGKVSAENYRDQIRQVVRVLEGKDDGFVRELKTLMEQAAEAMEYEDAAFWRDQLKHLEIVTATQVMDEAGSNKHRDVCVLAVKGGVGQAVVLQVRAGRVLSIKHLVVQNSDELADSADSLMEFLSQFYLIGDGTIYKRLDDASSSTDAVGSAVLAPTEILVDQLPTDAELLEKTIGFKIVKAESEVEKRLISVAQANAEYALENAVKRDQSHGIVALEEVQKKLGLERLPSRIECYDISNFQGDSSVASRVVFVDGAPNKNLYRRYKIRTVDGQNDFAMMKEVLSRRFSPDNDEPLPDLIVVDGGKGQLAQAVAILEELSLRDLGVVGLAKARTESDFQAAEVKSSAERCFLPGRKNPVILLPHTASFRILTHLRDEAHRFAITYHRQLRDKKSLASEQD